MTNSKSHMGFRLTPRSMTLDDLELHNFEFSVNFSGFRGFRTQCSVKRMKIGHYCQRQRCRHVKLEQFWQAFASRGFVSDSWAFLFCILLLSHILGILTETVILSNFEYLVNAVTLFITYKKSKV